MLRERPAQPDPARPDRQPDSGTNEGGQGSEHSFLTGRFLLTALALIILAVSVSALTQWLADPPPENAEGVFWFFAAAAQGIITLFAFLLAGYALVENSLRAIEARDETLVDVHDELRSIYFDHFEVVGVFVGIATVGSLAMILVNSNYTTVVGTLFLFSVTALIDFIAIGLAVFFVFELVNPARTQDAADAIRRRFSPGESSVENAKEFFDTYRKLERDFRELARTLSESRAESEEPPIIDASHFSTREAINMMIQEEIITREFADRLHELRQLRNALVHGREMETDQASVRRLQDSHDEIKRILEELESEEA